MAKPRKILVLVPNGASTDNRVVREAESLKGAGHDVLLAGVRRRDMPDPHGTTPKGVPIRRVDWRPGAYARIALLYIGIVVPLLVAVVAVLSVAAWHLYHAILAPLAAAVLDRVVGAMAAPGSFRIDHFRETQLGWYHAALVAVLCVSCLVIAIVFRWWLRPTAAWQRALGSPAFQAFRTIGGYLRHRGKRKPLRQYTSREMVVGSNGSPRRRVHDRVARYAIAKSRTQAFVSLGRQFRPEIVHCHEIGTLEAGTLLKRRQGCKVIYEAHEIYDDLAVASRHESTFNRRLHERYLPAADAFITVNEDIGDYYMKAYPAIATPVIVPNSVYPKSVVYDGRLHEAACLPADAKILLYQGGFSQHRGLFALLEAAYRLPEHWHVVFMGKGVLEKELKTRAARLQSDLVRETGRSDHRVRFVPMAPHSELVEWTSGASVGVIPYENIGLNHWFCSPNKIWEYPNAGVPILASGLHYLTAVLRKWDIGWIFSPTSPVEEIVAIVRSISDQELQEKRNNCARFIGEENYFVHEKRLIDLVESL